MRNINPNNLNFLEKLLMIIFYHTNSTSKTFEILSKIFFDKKIRNLEILKPELRKDVESLLIFDDQNSLKLKIKQGYEKILKLFSTREALSKFIDTEHKIIKKKNLVSKVQFIEGIMNGKNKYSYKNYIYYGYNYTKCIKDIEDAFMNAVNNFLCIKQDKFSEIKNKEGYFSSIFINELKRIMREDS